MGLLDDAIREHLELKRLRGADPGEVARAQREALDPVPRERDAVPNDHDATEQTAPAQDELSHGGEPAASEDAADGGQETAELDMRAELGKNEDATAAAISSASPPAAGAADPAQDHPEEDSSEWDTRNEAAPPPAASSPRDEQATRAEGTREGEHTAAPAESTLEQAPDFLGEMPEQEHLWLEQRPPA
jgi:hypothetical protein